jgi:hypothetical protein
LSQYPFPPPPYVPPTVDVSAWAYAQPHSAGRGAALWQFILAGIILLGGTCVGLFIFMPEQLMNEIAAQQQRSLQPIDHLSPVQEIRLIAIIGSTAMLAAGGLLLLLAFFVRRGGKVSTIFSVIVACGITLFLALSAWSDLLEMANNPMAVMPLLISVGVLGLCIVTIMKLVGVLRSSDTVQMQAMQQAYYWMMQQQQATGSYGQGGYGYGPGAAPPPAAPLQPPPPPPADGAGPTQS